MIKKKKDYTPFPPPQLPSKEDLLMEAGEYFQSQSKKRQRAEQDRAEAQVEKVAQRRAQRQAAFHPPEVSALTLTTGCGALTVAVSSFSNNCGWPASDMFRQDCCCSLLCC